jgi:hypothetical protein
LIDPRWFSVSVPIDRSKPSEPGAFMRYFAREKAEHDVFCEALAIFINAEREKYWASRGGLPSEVGSD